MALLELLLGEHAFRILHRKKQSRGPFVPFDRRGFNVKPPDVAAMVDESKIPAFPARLSVLCSSQQLLESLAIRGMAEVCEGHARQLLLSAPGQLQHLPIEKDWSKILNHRRVLWVEGKENPVMRPGLRDGLHRCFLPACVAGEFSHGGLDYCTRIDVRVDVRMHYFLILEFNLRMNFTPYFPRMQPKSRNLRVFLLSIAVRRQKDPSAQVIRAPDFQSRGDWRGDFRLLASEPVSEELLILSMPRNWAAQELNL